MITEEMRKAGNDIAAHLMDAHIAKCLGGLGGNKGWDEWAQEFTGKNLDLIKQYVDEEIDSVTAIYTAMERERK